MTKRERQLLGCLVTCLGTPPDASSESSFEAQLGAVGRLLGTPTLTFGVQEVATRRVLFTAKGETDLDSADGELTWSSIPSDTGVLRSLFRVVPFGDGTHRALLGGMAEVPDDEPTREMLAKIVPKLAERALALRRRRDEPTTSLPERAFELLPFPALLLADDGSIELENKAAQAALADGPPLHRRDRVLRVCDRELDQKLRRMLRELTAEATTPSLLTIPRDGKRPLSLLLSRLPAPRAREQAPGHVLVLICDPQRRSGAVRELLVRSYGLTGSEARVALAVLEGKSVEQLAGELYISLNTAKTHLKSIFAKVGTGRQSELVATILTGPVGLLR